MEFLPYPHLIPTLFNGCGSGPPRNFTSASTWTWIGHPVSGLPALTLRPFETWFPFGSMAVPFNLASTGNSPDRSTKSTRSHLNVLPQLVNTGFQVLFHSPPGVLFTFPSQYYALSVTKEYLALRVVPPTSHKVSRVSWYSGSCRCLPFSCTGLSPSGLPSQAVPLTDRLTYAVHNPSMHARWFGLLPFRSPLLSESMFLSLPAATWMFQFTGFPPYPMDSCTVTEVCSSGFPHSDISGSMDICSSPKLFAAYHVLHRLSVPRHPPCALFSLTKRFSAGAGYLSQMHSVASLVWVVYKICCIVSMINHLITWPRMS